jgi:hypothetical protein
MIKFIVGALAGGAAAWWYRNDIEKYMNQRLPNVRQQAADRLIALEQRAEEALGRARQQIERMRPSESHVPGRSTGTYTHGTGV